MSELTEQFEAKRFELDIEMYRGDTLSKKLFQAANTDDTPYNLSNYKFYMQIRPDPLARKAIATFGHEYFILGQSQDAIDYDIAEGNPVGTTKDELHIKVDSVSARLQSGEWFYDLETEDEGWDVYTPIYGKINIIQDVTRINE